MSAIATLFLYHTGFVLLCHMEGIYVCVCLAVTYFERISAASELAL